MNREEALELVKMTIKGPRLDHTMRVAETAKILATQYKADIVKAEIAAILHDYAKLLPMMELKRILMEANEDPRLLQFHPELWHGPAAAYILEKQYKVEDQEILHAIRYHTTGRAAMGLLEKIIYLADYIEPGRSFSAVTKVRELAKIDLDHAILQALKNQISYLMDQQSAIFPDTFEAYNDLINRGGYKFGE